MSRFPLFDIGRDVSVAVGAYIGMLKTRFLEELSGDDGFDERLAAAKARFDAADALAEKEAEEEVAEPLWRPSHPTQTIWTQPGIMYGAPVPAALCADRGAPCSPICDDCRVRPDTGLNGREERHAKTSDRFRQQPAEMPGGVEVSPPSPSPSGRPSLECPYCHHRLPRALFTTQK